MKKIPEISAAFWIMKICATTLGETAGDLFSMTLNIGYALSSLFLILFFVIILQMQLRATKYNPLIYWFAILATSTAGTTISDYIDRSLKLGYALGSFILTIVLITILLLWKKSEKTLSVNQINSFRGEVFYWTAILVSNTLGTALGDFLADSSNLGFLGGALLIGACLLLIFIAYYFSKISRIVLFWMAFIFTRPFGATFGDLMTKSKEKGGLNFGTIGSSLVLFVILITLIVIAIIKNKNKLNKTENSKLILN